jgi:hypothetical protein
VVNASSRNGPNESDSVATPITIYPRIGDACLDEAPCLPTPEEDARRCGQSSISGC